MEVDQDYLRTGTAIGSRASHEHYSSDFLFKNLYQLKFCACYFWLTYQIMFMWLWTSVVGRMFHFAVVVVSLCDPIFGEEGLNPKYFSCQELQKLRSLPSSGSRMTYRFFLQFHIYALIDLSVYVILYAFVCV